MRKSKKAAEQPGRCPPCSERRAESTRFTGQLPCAAYKANSSAWSTYVFLSYPPVCLICMSTNHFQVNAKEKGNVVYDDLLKSPCICLIMDARPSLLTQLHVLSLKMLKNGN